ncbi:MAG: glycosyltransferase family 2 protein [Propionibacteriaceae bacterium]|jgi:glycosyltransferase involved in cell wall biosynthesis|nr:glycosyltransferase family 2 protein [Propionibacteriaceae bacterium]
MPRISVIVPVYNVEEYLPLCLDSIRQQSLADLEILCVNDGSTDRGPAILAAAAAVDPRITVIDQPNGGLSAARNAGLRAASAPIVMFVDSDDFLDKRACATVAAAFDRHDPDIVTFGSHCHPASAAYPWLSQTLSPRDAVYNRFSPKLLFKENSRPFVWRSAFSSDFLRRTGLEFDEHLRFGEDQVFHFLSYPAARRTVLLSDKLYYYRVARPESLMSLRGEDALAKLREHLVIIRCILAGWRERDWLSLCPLPLLQWILEFAVFDILGQPLRRRTELARALVELIDEFFDPGTLSDGLDEPTARLLALLRQTQSPTGSPLRPLSEQAVAFSYFLSQRGPLWGAKRLFRGALALPPLSSLRFAARRLLPSPAASTQRRLDEIDGLAQDASRRLMSLELLRTEYGALQEARAANGRADELPVSPQRQRASRR